MKRTQEATSHTTFLKQIYERRRIKLLNVKEDFTGEDVKSSSYLLR